jgi:hypothetical protein
MYACIRVGHKAGPCTATFNDLLCFKSPIHLTGTVFVHRKDFNVFDPLLINITLVSRLLADIKVNLN